MFAMSGFHAPTVSPVKDSKIFSWNKKSEMMSSMSFRYTFDVAFVSCFLNCLISSWGLSALGTSSCTMKLAGNSFHIRSWRDNMHFWNHALFLYLPILHISLSSWLYSRIRFSFSVWPNDFTSKMLVNTLIANCGEYDISI